MYLVLLISQKKGFSPKELTSEGGAFDMTGNPHEWKLYKHYDNLYSLITKPFAGLQTHEYVSTYYYDEPISEDSEWRKGELIIQK